MYTPASELRAHVHGTISFWMGHFRLGKHNSRLTRAPCRNRVAPFSQGSPLARQRSPMLELPEPVGEWEFREPDDSEFTRSFWLHELPAATAFFEEHGFVSLLPTVLLFGTVACSEAMQSVLWSVPTVHAGGAARWSCEKSYPAARSRPPQPRSSPRARRAIRASTSATRPRGANFDPGPSASHGVTARPSPLRFAGLQDLRLGLHSQCSPLQRLRGASCRTMSQYWIRQPLMALCSTTGRSVPTDCPRPSTPSSPP